MMRRLILIPFLLLAACGAQSSPKMIGASRTDVVRDGRSYAVFFKDNRVEVIRLGYARNGEHHGIRATMMALIPEVTGCALVERSLEGDSGVMRATVRCSRPG